MKTKQCTICKTIKEVSRFYKHKQSKGGLKSECKDCTNARVKAYARTKKGIITKIYAHQKASSKQRGHRLPEYTKKELQEWAFSQTLFHELYSEWVNSGYLKRLIPSFDRKCDYIHYCMANIQLMTWGDNHYKSHKDRVNGINNKASKAVYQFTKDGCLVAEYYSTHEAARQTEGHQGHISECCKGKRRSSDGFVWEYKENTGGVSSVSYQIL